MKEKTRKLINSIHDACSDGTFVFRGTNEVRSKIDGKKAADGISSSLYRWAREKNILNENYDPPDIEKDIVESAKKHFPAHTSNIEILTDMRHYEGKVNIIDFTRDIHIALFFACQPKYDEESKNEITPPGGEIIILNVHDCTKLEKLEYGTSGDLTASLIEKHEQKDTDTLPELAIIEPSQTHTSRGRVIAQDSVFIYPKKGYVDQKYLKKIIPIPHDVKTDILNHISTFHNINISTIYNDLIGFMQNEENYNTPAVFFFQGNAAFESEEYEDAKDFYTKAIELNPQDAEVYNNRGVTYYEQGNFSAALQDYNKAIELNPQYTSAYFFRGLVYSKRKEFDTAISDFTKAIELDLQYVAAYNNRGFAYYKQGNYSVAIQDFATAIELDPQLAITYLARSKLRQTMGDEKGAQADLARYEQLQKIIKQKSGGDASPNHVIRLCKQNEE